MARKIRKAGVKQVPWDDRLEKDPRFLRRIGQARADLRAGRGVRLEDIELKDIETEYRVGCGMP
jgi:hypothetical protein